MKKLNETIKFLANKAARHAGRAKATKIRINYSIGTDASLVESKSAHHITKSGKIVYFANAYLKKARSARLIYVSAKCVVDVNPKLICLRHFGELYA